jgi:hypothetical protein
MLPLWWIKPAACAAAAAALFGAGWAVNGWRLNAELERINARRAAAMARAEAEQRKQEAEWVAAQQEIAHVASLARQHAEADRRVADRAHQRLLDAARAAAGQAAQHPAAAGGGETTSGPGLLLAELLGRADGVAGELAEAYDNARIAGLACERAYEVTRQPQPDGSVKP